jgi:ABC-type lipoprotein release transport system permease subunit
MNQSGGVGKIVILRLAWRNLVGHLRRTLLTIGAIALGLAALIFLWAFNDGLHRNMLANFQDAIIGSIQIHHRGFFAQPELSSRIKRPERVIATLEELGIENWTRRLETFALASSEQTTEGAMVIGIDPAQEPRVTQISQRIGAGRFLREQDEYALILGRTTASNLKLTLGDPVVLVGYDQFGALVAEEFTLVGVITSGELGLDRGMALTTLRALQEMLDMPGGITNLVLRVPEAQIAKLQQTLVTQLAGEDLEVMTWSDMFPVMQEWITLHNGFLYLFVGVVLIIVLAGELNTMLLSTLERTREFGVLRAIGTRRRHVALLLILESGLIGVVGIAAGIVLGWSLVSVTSYTGIDLSRLLGSTSRFYVDPVIFPNLRLEHLGITMFSILLASLLAGLYPAWRVSRLRPVEAIRNG